MFDGFANHVFIFVDAAAAIFSLAGYFTEL